MAEKVRFFANVGVKKVENLVKSAILSLYVTSIFVIESKVRLSVFLTFVYIVFGVHERHIFVQNTLNNSI